MSDRVVEVLELDELRRDARHLFHRFSPYLEDDNDWYRCGHFDGKDAQWVAEFSADVLQLLNTVVSPVAVEPGLRERIRKAVVSVKHETLKEVGYVDSITDAVMAVLAGAAPELVAGYRMVKDCERCSGTGKKTHWQKNQLHSLDPMTFCDDCKGKGWIELAGAAPTGGGE